LCSAFETFVTTIYSTVLFAFKAARYESFKSTFRSANYTAIGATIEQTFKSTYLFTKSHSIDSANS